MIYSNMLCNEIAIDETTYRKKEGLELKMHYKELMQTAGQFAKNVQILFDPVLWDGEPKDIFYIFLRGDETYEI